MKNQWAIASPGKPAKSQLRTWAQGCAVIFGLMLTGVIVLVVMAFAFTDGKSQPEPLTASEPVAGALLLPTVTPYIWYRGGTLHSATIAAWKAGSGGINWQRLPIG